MCCGAMDPSDWHNRTLVGNASFEHGFYPSICCGDTSPHLMVYLHYPEGNSSRTQQPEILFHLPSKHYPTNDTNSTTTTNNTTTNSTTSTSGSYNATFLSSCTGNFLQYQDGCLSDVQLERYQALVTTVFTALLIFLFLLITLTCCLERDRKHCGSQVVNQQYADHLDFCLGPQGGSRILSWT